jgi:hypothetical protein
VLKHFGECSSENKAVSGALAYKAPRVRFQLACSFGDIRILIVALTGCRIAFFFDIFVPSCIERFTSAGK